MLIPEFTENTDRSMLLYFNADGEDINKMYEELEKTYVCFEKMNKVIKNGSVYVLLEISDAEG